MQLYLAVNYGTTNMLANVALAEMCCYFFKIFSPLSDIRLVSQVNFKTFGIIAFKKSIVELIA